jgi:subtilisin family serine protease
VRRNTRGLVAATIAVAALASSAAAPAAKDTPGSESKLRGGLGALVAGTAVPDPAVARLTAGYRRGELVYFAVLAAPADASAIRRLEAAGARIVRTYRTVEAVALASPPSVVRRIAALRWVEALQPVRAVHATADEAPVDQTRGTPQDVGAAEWWSRGVTGAGVRIAVLDTGGDALHPDLDDLDFGHWSSLLNPPKLIEARNFVGGGCAPLAGNSDAHGHGTHVAGIATGTGEGTPLATDNGKHAGIAPGASLAVGKVMTDTGVGINSDLLAAMEWAAMPVGSAPCAVGADIVNLSLGSESRPDRLNSGDDVDLVSLTLDRLAVRYGTLFVAAAGNSGPFLGSVLEAPGAASQALSVAATAKDYDLNHDDTYAGDTCAGWRHPRSTSQADNDCSAGVGDQPPSIASFSSRGPSGDLWLRPDLAAPGYDIVSAQSSLGTAIGSNDITLGTRADPLYATASGTSMATPAAAGSAALVLDAYRQAHGANPSGSSGLAGLSAPAYALIRAALMNSAGGDLYESRWILTTDASTQASCPQVDPVLMTFCELGTMFTDLLAGSVGSLTLFQERNGAADPYVGPLAEGAGKVNVGRAISALRDGLVVYSAASGSGADRGTGPRDLQGSWQVGAVAAGSSASQNFVVHPAPGSAATKIAFSFQPGNPSDGSSAIPTGKRAWTVKLPTSATVRAGKDTVVTFALTVPSTAAPGLYSGVIVGQSATGQTIRIPVFAAVALQDRSAAANNPPGPQARVTSGHDVFGKDDTTWPSVAGSAGTGSGADWLVYPVDIGSGGREARFTVYDAAAGDETYDLYLYDSSHRLVASTHPFAAPGVTDRVANNSRPPSTAATPQVLSVASPAAGRYFVAVSRARIGGTTPGDFGRFVLTLDERG